MVGQKEEKHHGYAYGWIKSRAGRGEGTGFDLALALALTPLEVRCPLPSVAEKALARK